MQLSESMRKVEFIRRIRKLCLKNLEISNDADAKNGHKTADTSIFGYKTHMAMTEESIITAATITSGEKIDGKELPELIRKSREAGMEVETVISDKVYSEQKNMKQQKKMVTN